MTYGIVTICLNAAATIGTTMRSVLTQSPPPAEYVLVDGGSTDGTRGVIQAAMAQARDAGSPVAMRLLDQRGGGAIPGAWNEGLAALSCDVVGLLNSDDWYEPGAGATVLAAFLADPELGVYAGAQYLRRDEQDLQPRVMRPKPLWLFPLLMPLVHPACFVRRSVYERVGTFDTRYRISADYDFLYRCHCAGVRIRRDPRPLVNMRTGGLAGRSRALARRETYEVARRHAPAPLLPYVAYLVRAAFGR